MSQENSKDLQSHNPNPSQSISCPSCKANITLYLGLKSELVICGQCASRIQTSGAVKLIGHSAEKKYRKQYLTLGQIGKLHGTYWQVVGYLERVDGTESYEWSEYLLYNSQKGFRWLTEAGGHWNYVIPTTQKPQVLGIAFEAVATYLGKQYQLFHKGEARVKHISGEFYWVVEEDEKVNVEDFINPPELLSKESNDKETIWSVGTYLEPEDLKAGFQLSEDLLPSRDGVAPNQPARTKSKLIENYWFFFVMLVCAVQSFVAYESRNEVVHNGVYRYIPNDTDKVKVSPQFELKGRESNIKFVMSAPLSNNWIELQVDLVNDVTGETREFEHGTEYYTGTDYDGTWSEGSQGSELILSSVPPGKYHINVEASTGNSLPLEYNITMIHSVVTWSNFLWAFGLLTIVPLVVWFRSRSFEVNRWSQSDYSPYPAHHEGT